METKYEFKVEFTTYDGKEEVALVTIIGGKSACDAVLVGIENHLSIPPVEDVDE